MELHFEISCLQLEVRKLNFIIVDLYRSPTSNLEFFFDNLYQFLHKHSTNRSKCLILGDMNINNLKTPQTTLSLGSTTCLLNLKLRLSTYPSPG